MTMTLIQSMEDTFFTRGAVMHAQLDQEVRSSYVQSASDSVEGEKRQFSGERC